LCGGGPDEVAADTRFLDSEAISCKIEYIFHNRECSLH
jgi:hypothetical protein